MPRRKREEAKEPVEETPQDTEEIIEEPAAASSEELGSAEEPVGGPVDEDVVTRAEYEEVLRAKDELARQLEERDNEYQEKTRNLEYVLGRQGQQIGDLTRMVEKLSTPQQTVAQPRKRVKLDPIGDENFAETLDSYLGETLAESQTRLRRELEEKHQRDLENLRWELGVQRDAEVLKKDYGFTQRDIEEAAEYGTRFGIPNLQAAAFLVPRLQEKIFSRRNGYRRDDRNRDYRRGDHRRDDWRPVSKPDVSARKVAEELSKPKPTPPLRGGGRTNDGDIMAKIASLTPEDLDRMTEAERADLYRKAQQAALAGSRQQF